MVASRSEREVEVTPVKPARVGEFPQSYRGVLIMCERYTAEGLAQAIVAVREEVEQSRLKAAAARRRDATEHLSNPAGCKLEEVFAGALDRWGRQ